MARSQNPDHKVTEWKEIEEEDDNMLVKLERPRLQEQFFDYLKSHTSLITALVSQDLLLLQHQHCIVADRTEWKSGDFNVCIPISISNWRPQRLMMRCLFPHMLGLYASCRNSDSIDEKLRCEAATFAWISQQCTQVPIPRLWGFGLPNGLSFTPVAHLRWYSRAFKCIKDLWAWLCGRPRWAPFVPRQTQLALKSGYMLVDFIEEAQGTMLSKVWPPKLDEQKRNFYRSLSKIMLDLTSRPLEKIGSFTVNNLGEINLSNRPLIARLPLLESEGVPTDIPRNRTYFTTDSYIRDLLKCHDMKLKYQPNAVRDKYDAEAQMAVLTMMRALPLHFSLDYLRTGPFGYIWADDHTSNIFVDHQYNITCLPDLEWFHSSPLEALHPPFWLSGHAVDQLGEEKRKEYDDMCIEFLEVFEQEDNRPSVLGPGFRTKVMRNALEKNAHWFWASLNDPRATYNLFLEHLQPIFAPSHLEEEESIQFQRILAPYWTEGTTRFIDQKLLDRKLYLKELRSKYMT